MQNGYFQLVKTLGGFGIQFFAAKDGGQDIHVAEVLQYLDKASIAYDRSRIIEMVASKEDTMCFLSRKDCPALDETYRLEISGDSMEATAYFYPPSETGKRMSIDEFAADLSYKKIVSGIQKSVLQEHFLNEGIYCTQLVVAKGKEPRQGTDARIEYLFNTEVHARPTLREDGTVDFYNLNVINHCKKGDVLARIIPQDVGEAGYNILGKNILPRPVKSAVLKFGKNVQITEDKKEISATTDGHVLMTDGKVFVSDVYETDNVDLSTGNLEFDGSIQVKGNVAANRVVKAKGNVVVNGVVEGAHIVAGGDIIIARGMNGISKGILEAGGNIYAKYIENATVIAEGHISAEAILHSHATAGTEITVVGKRGFITGGHVQARNRVVAKNLGAAMGSTTIVEVGVNAEIKAEYLQLQKEVMEAAKIVKNTQPAIDNFHEKKAKGIRFSEDQMRYLKEIARSYEENRAALMEKNKKMLELKVLIESQSKAEVVVEGTAYPGTTIIIGEASMPIEKNYRYCRFEKKEGEVKMAAM